MKKYSTSLISALLLVSLLISGFIFDFSSTDRTARAAGFIYQDFENPVFPPVGWTVNNTSGYDWVRTVSCSGYGNDSASIKADFFDYQSGNFNLITPMFPPSSPGDTLSFDHAYATYSSENDHLIIYTSTNNGSSWITLITLNGGVSGPLVTAPPHGNVFIPTSTEWATKSYALPVGTNKIRFTGVTAYGNNLYLDNIRLGTTYSIDVGGNSVYLPKNAITPGSITPKTSFKNYGTTTQSFQVTLKITPGSYSDTKSVSSLAPGQSQLVTFANHTLSTNGTYTMRAYSSLGSDQNHLNDTIVSQVIVTPSPRNVVLEYSTGTWCLWCPCGKQWAHELELHYPNSIVLAYHGGGSDPFQNFNGNSILGLLGLTSYPSGVIDRIGKIGWGSFFTNGEGRYSTSPASPVQIEVISQSYNSSTKQLSVSLDATALENLSGQYKISYVVTEDNLIYSQSGNSTCPGGTNYVHLWVVRNMVNGATGENLNSGGTWNNGQKISKSFTTTIDNAWTPANCNLQVFVYKSQGALNMSEIQQGIKRGILMTGVGNQNAQIPTKYELSQNYPNPFNPVTNIKFAIPKDGNVSLKIFDMLGRLVDVYMDGFIKAGYYNAEIDGIKLTSGVYFYTLKADDYSETKKMLLIK